MNRALLGNGVTEDDVYDASTGMAQSMATYKGSTAIRAVSYWYDHHLNLTRQKKSLVGVEAEEAFSYDSLQRLKSSTRTWTDGTPSATTAYTYDLVGNILSKGDYATGYLYGSASRSIGKAGPHAVRQVTRVSGGTTTYTYDDNGNMLTGDGRTVDYDLRDRAVRITQGTSWTEFKYAPDGMRYRQKVGSTPSEYGARTVYYLDKDYEFTVLGPPGIQLEARSYLGSVVAFRSGTTSASMVREERYLHLDHLGSLDATTNAAGTEFVDASGVAVDSHGFDAFGGPRTRSFKENGAKLHPYGDRSVTTTRGFTGHEHLDVVSIIHMNGRVYDYQLGRFLSVDPFISNPLSSQAINPYSYIGNNPLSGTDPTGYMPDRSLCEGSDSAGNCKTAQIAGPQPALKASETSTKSGAPGQGTTEPSTDTTKVLSTTEINKNGSGKTPTLGDLADKWEKYRQSYREWLASKLTPGTTFGEKAGLATLTLSVELGAGLADLGRLGKGASDGGVKGLAQDGLRALSLGLMGWGLSRSLTLAPEVAAPQGASAPALGAEEGAKVFRVWGGEAGPWGRSWTPVDPRTVSDFRGAAGLPVQNSGRFLSEGVLQNTEGVLTKPASPLHGNPGGMPEVVIPNPAGQVRLRGVQGLNPEF